MCHHTEPMHSPQRVTSKGFSLHNQPSKNRSADESKSTWKGAPLQRRVPRGVGELGWSGDRGGYSGGDRGGDIGAEPEDSQSRSTHSTVPPHSQQQPAQQGLGLPREKKLPREAQACSETKVRLQSQPSNVRAQPAAAAVPNGGMLGAWARRMRADVAPSTSAESADKPVFPGLATGKGAAHAMMLQCILQLRDRSGVFDGDSVGHMHASDQPRGYRRTVDLRSPES